MPLVEPLPVDHSPEVARVAQFFNETLGFPPNSVLTMRRRPEIAKGFTLSSANIPSRLASR